MCLTGSLRIQDLDLTLTKGMVVYLPEARAKSSLDLQRVWQAKGVHIQYVERFSKMRPPDESNSTSPAHRQRTAPVDSDRVLFDPQALAEQIITALGQDAIMNDRVRIAVAARMGELEERITTRVVAALRAELAGLAQAPVRVSVQDQPHAIPVQKILPDVEEKAPVFIPSRIGDGDLKGGVAVTAQQGDDAGLNEAAAALRRTRKKEK
jgi:hypothetical protein